MSRLFVFAYYITVNKAHLKTIANIYSQYILCSNCQCEAKIKNFLKRLHVQMLPFIENECIPVVEHWLEQEIAMWVHHERSIR